MVIRKTLLALVLLAVLLVGSIAGGDRTMAQEAIDRSNPYILGIGGIFIRAEDKSALAEWYRDKLGIDSIEAGHKTFFWKHPDAPEVLHRTVWGLFEADTRYFEGPVMINYVVSDLKALLAHLKSEGVNEAKPAEHYDYGSFGWVVDAEGNWIELWEPPEEMPEGF